MPVKSDSSPVLTSYLEERASTLHHSISLREDDGTSALASFVERYIELAPEFIAAFEDFFLKAGVGGEIHRQVGTAREFLEAPADIVSPEEGLEANMYQAYLAHRLLEEINDVLRSRFNCPIIPVDMTRSNLVIHHIIGEPFANQMDSAVELLTDKLLESTENDKSLQAKLYAYNCRAGKDPSQRYPCLTESSNIRLLFKSQNSRVRLH